MGYDYSMMCSDAEKLCAKYPFAQLFSIGESTMQKPIYCIKAGTGKRRLFINAAHHGLEYITSALVMRFLSEYFGNIKNNAMIYSYNARRLFERTVLYVVPMVNPDGVDLAVNGINLENKWHCRLADIVGLPDFKRVWQANINGVDINHNYDAHWQKIRSKPAPTRYCGEFPESECETRAMVNFTKSVGFDAVIAYHSQGEEIYYDFNGLTASNSYELGQLFSELTGYRLCVPEEAASFGGYKDWFIEKFSKAGFTVEVGLGENPLPLTMLDDIYRRNLPLMVSALAYC